MRRLLPLVAVLVLAPPASGLSGLADGGGKQLVRVGLDRGPLEARAVEGAPTVLGEAVAGNWTRLDDVEPEPWRGYERTVQLRVGGNGTVLLADAESGLLVEVGANRSPGRGAGSSADGNDTSPARQNGTERGSDGGTASPNRDPNGTGTSSARRGGGAATVPPPATSPSPGTNATSPDGDRTGSDQPGAGRGSSGDEYSEASEGRDPLLWVALGVSLAVGVGPWVVREARRRLRRIGGHDASEETEEDAGRVSDPRERFDDDRYPWLSPDPGGRDRRRR